MKRLIDMRSVGTGPLFAFWCTVKAAFESFGGDRSFDSVADFRQAYEMERNFAGLDLENDFTGLDIERYLRLIPEWVPE